MTITPALAAVTAVHNLSLATYNLSRALTASNPSTRLHHAQDAANLISEWSPRLTGDRLHVFVESFSDRTEENILWTAVLSISKAQNSLLFDSDIKTVVHELGLALACLDTLQYRQDNNDHNI